MRLRSHAWQLKLVSAVGHESSRVDELTLASARGDARQLAKRDSDDLVAADAGRILPWARVTHRSRRGDSRGARHVTVRLQSTIRFVTAVP